MNHYLATVRTRSGAVQVLRIAARDEPQAIKRAAAKLYVNKRDVVGLMAVAPRHATKGS